MKRAILPALFVPALLALAGCSPVHITPMDIQLAVERAVHGAAVDDGYAVTRCYKLVDAADTQPARPDFAIPLYPGHLWSGEGIGLAPWIRVRHDAPPTFLLQSMVDPVDDVHESIAYALALRAAKVPVEMHLYAEGGHAFGLRPTPFPISGWPALVEKWLHTIGVN